jgi:hypothetical protein
MDLIDENRVAVSWNVDEAFNCSHLGHLEGSPSQVPGSHAIILRFLERASLEPQETRHPRHQSSIRVQLLSSMGNPIAYYSLHGEEKSKRNRVQEGWFTGRSNRNEAATSRATLVPVKRCECDGVRSLLAQL